VAFAHTITDTPATAASLQQRFQVTETVGMSETAGMSETMMMTDTMSMSETMMSDTTPVTDTMAMPETAAMTDTMASDMMPMHGTGPENALSPAAETVTLDPGAIRWYTFKYDWDGESDPSEVIAELQMEEAGSISFEVWSQDDLQRWQNGEDFTPTGAGTPAVVFGDENTDRDRARLRWVGSSAATVTFYLLVENNSDSSAAYMLTITGDTISFPMAQMSESSVMSDTMAMTETMAMTMTEEPAMITMPMGTGPADAMTPTGQQATIEVDESRWYSFKYSWDGESDPSNAIVELRMADAGMVSFEVWSEEDVAMWEDGVDFTPTGAGTPAFTLRSSDSGSSRDRTLLRWVGSGEETVTYYVIVENNSDAPADYRLTVSGRDVSFPAPTMDAAAEDDTSMSDTSISDTTAMTETMGITDTMMMTDTMGLTETMGVTDTVEITETMELTESTEMSDSVELTETNEISSTEETP